MINQISKPKTVGQNMLWTHPRFFFGVLFALIFLGLQGMMNVSAVSDEAQITVVARLETVTVNNVDSISWSSVPLTNSYNSMVAICTTNYQSNTIPQVVRMRNAVGNSLEIRLQNPSDNTLNGENAHCLVTEEGVWQLPDGRKLEAHKYTSALTDHKNSWDGEQQSLAYTYETPVVLGQVMSFNDSRWSVFWSRGKNVSTPASSAKLFTGKHVGEDTDVTRLDETIGYIVLEAGNGIINGIPYEAAIGEDSVRGIDPKSAANRPPYTYAFTQSFTVAPAGAIVSQAAMDGKDGSWIQLYGSTPLRTDEMDLFADNDQIRDDERKHTSEQAGYFLFAEHILLTDSPPTPTATATNIPAATATSIATNTPYVTPTPDSTLAPTNTPTSVPTDTPTPTDTSTATPTDPPTNTPAPTNTPTAIPTNTPTDTPTPTNTPTAEPTATPITLPTPVPNSETVSVLPGSQTVDVGSVFTITVNISDINSPISAYQFDLAYDSNLLRLDNVDEGDFLLTAGQDVVCPAWVEPTADSMRLACVSVGSNAGAVGTGHLATLSFTALAVGNSDLTLSAVQLADTSVPPAAVGVTLVNGQVAISAGGSANVPIMVASADNDGGNGSVWANAWQSAQVENIGGFLLLFVIAGFLLIAGKYLHRRRQLNYMWRLLIVVSMLLQTLLIMPPVTHAVANDSAVETGNATIRPNNELRSTANLVPPVSPTAVTSQGCYDADLDCDKDVDEADVTRSSYSWDCGQGAACYDIDADMDDNNIVDALDLAWITNDYDIAPPEISISTPSEGGVITGSDLIISGLLTDTHNITQVTVNGAEAAIVGNTFSVQLPVESDNYVLDVLAQDEIGMIGLSSRVVSADQSGPVVKIETPANGQAAYVATPDVVVSYSDFLSTVNPASFAAEVRDNLGNTVQTFDNSVAGNDSALFTLSPLTLGQSYTLLVSIADIHGNVSMTSSSFFVTPDTNIAPPITPENPGWISGYIYDSSTCNQYLTTCQGLAGAQVTLVQVDPDALESARSIRAEEYETAAQLNGTFPAGSDAILDEFATPIAGTLLTGPDGFYAFPVDTTGVYHLRVEKDGFTYGQKEISAVRERSTAVDEIYLTPIDPAITICSEVGCTHTSADTQMTVEIPVGAIPSGEQIEVTATEFDRVFFLPSGDLPPGTEETYAFNLGGSSDYEFQKPITVSLKNSRGFAPETIIPLGYWNQYTQQWEHEGVATVDVTGEWLTMQVTHFSNHDPNFPVVTRLSNIYANTEDETEEDDACADGEEGCFINLKSGVLRDWISLPPVSVVGDSEAPQLTYSTSRANPSAVIDIKLDVDSFGNTIADKLTWELYIEGQKTDQFTFAANLDVDGEVGRYRYLWDGHNALGELLPPGMYAFAVKIAIPYEAEYCRTTRRFGDFSCAGNSGTGVFTTVTKDVWTYGEVALNSQLDSSLGAGWSLQDQQFLYEDEAGRILATNGDALTQHYFDLNDQLDGRQIYNNVQPASQGPASVDFPALVTSGGTVVNGVIDTNTTWTLAQSPFIVQDQDITVAAGSTLTIEPGVQVMLDRARNMVVQGNLDALGTTTLPITLTAYYDGSDRGVKEYLDQYSFDGHNFNKLINITSVAIDATGDVWLAGNIDSNYGGNLSIKRLRNDRVTVDDFPLPDGFTVTSQVHDIVIDSQGRVWFATNYGVLMLPPGGTDFVPFSANTSGLAGNDVRAVSIDDTGDIWFAIYGEGIQRLASDGTNWNVTLDTGNSAIPTDNVLDIEFDNQGHLWVGTDNGLSSYEPTNNIWTPYNLDAGWPNEAESIALDLNGNVWITVPDTGIRMLSVANGAWEESFTDANGLKSNSVLAITVDAYGQKWIGHEFDGVSVLSPNNTSWDYKEDILSYGGTIYDFSTTSSGDVWLSDGDIYHIYSSGGMIDGSIIGGYWGSLNIQGTSNLSNVVLEMGGGDKSSTLVINTDLNADNLTVRAGGGHGIEVTDGHNLTLTNATLLANRGEGLHLGAGSQATLTDVTVQQNKEHGIFLSDGGQLVATRTAVIANDQYAIYADSANTTVSLTEVTIEANQSATRLPLGATIDANSSWIDNRRKEIEWHGGTLASNYTWLDDLNIETHIILSDTVVASGAALTIPAGVSMRFAENAGLTVAGSLTAVGSFDAPIYLGALDPTLSWDGLTLSGATADLQYVTVQNANTGIHATNGSVATMSQMTIANNVIGILTSNNGMVSITESNLTGNSNFAVRNDAGAGYVVTARGNYWGHPDGPTHATHPFGQGDLVSDNVDFTSWRAPVILDDEAIFVESRTKTDTTRLSYDPGSDTYSRYYPDGRIVYFDTQNRHDYTLYPDGRTKAYTYNPDGSTATMAVTAPGQSVPTAVWTFNYTAGRLDSITDPTGRIVDFTVDANNQLRQVDIPGMGSRQFHYNEDNLLTQQVDEANTVTSYGYDVYGRIASHKDPTRAVYDPQTGETTFTGELRHFKTSDTGYDLINVSAVGDPGNPASAVPTSADLSEQITYGIGGRTTKTNEWGHLTEQTDALDRTMNMERDEANHVTRIDLPGGDCIEADYDELGNVLSASRLPADQCAIPSYNRDPNAVQTSARTYEPRFNQPKTMISPSGEQVVYYYDYELGQGDAGRVVRIDYPAIPNEQGVLTTPSVYYTYNSLGLIETETDVRGTVTRYLYTQGTLDEAADGANPLFASGVTPVPGLITQTVEDDGGFGYTTTYKNFDALGNPQTIVFPGGHETTSIYDALGRVITATNVNGIVTLYEYDDRGSVTRKVVDYTADGITGDNIVTTYEYDSNGRLVHERTAADGLVLEAYSKYDINGRLVSQTDSEGNETRYIYDDAGQLTQTIDAANHSSTYTYTDDGQPETVTDAENHTSRTIYDEFGRAYQTIQAEGELNLTTTYTYTVDNLVSQTEAPDGVVTCFEYDKMHRRTKTIQDCGLGGLNLTSSYAYDIAGNTVYMTNTRGIVTYTEYDALGRVRLTRQDDGGLNYETQTTYDSITGNLDTTTSVDGTVSKNIYDSLNRLEQSCQDYTGLNLCTTYTYDRRGRQETITDAEGVVQQTIYNKLGLAIQDIADVNGLATTISYEYDNLLNMVQVTDPNGNPTQYSYTPLQQIETELYADGTSVSYTYDPRGNIATTTLQDSAVITRTYDAANRQSLLEFSTGGSQSFVYDPSGRMVSATQTMAGHSTVTGYGYNIVGDVVTTTQQLDGGTAWLTQYAYDYMVGERTVTYPSGAIRTYTMDDLNRLDTVETGSGTVIADYNYDVINRFNTIAYPSNGLTNRQDYDALGRTMRVSVNNGAADIVDYGYGYDNVGNRTFMQRNHRPGQLADVYEYDGLYQLVDVWYGADATTPGAITSSASEQSYNLDDLGNRLTVTEDGTTENYGPNNGAQLTNTMNRYESVEGQPLGYDIRGNTLTDGRSVYTYDILNRQTSVENGSGITDYIYDARGRRVAKVNGANTTNFIYDTQYRVIEERDGSNTVLATYTYGQGMDEPLMMERGGQTYTYHRDALGSVTEVSDVTGTIIERYEYDVYGAPTIYDSSDNVLTMSAIDNPYLFTGRRYDVESDNYYYRARYYSHDLGRFLSEDPLGFDAGDYNLYRYVFNNPTNSTDPTGEFAFLPWLLKAGTEAAVDALMQATVNYFIDPGINTVGEAFGSVNWKQVAWAGATGLLPGGGLAKAAFVAVGDVIIAYLDALSKCEEYTTEDALFDFAFGVASEFVGDKLGDLVAKYGRTVVAAGLRKLGLDEVAEKLLREVDEVVDDVVPSPTLKCSFSEETLVSTDEGYLAIGEIEIGDYVLAFDEKTGEVGYYPVTAVWEHDDPVIVYLTIDGETIETTPEHPFYTTSGKWVAAGELHAGNEIYKADGSYGVVENVAFVYQLQPMYNLTVATAHTYFVGQDRLLVHNVCGSFFSKFKEGTGFSTVYDHARDSIFAKPSSYDIPKHSGVHVIDGVEWVPANGGHMDVANEAIGQGSQLSHLWGFAVIYEGPKKINVISWRSIGLNQYHNAISNKVTTGVQKRIIKRLETDLPGWTITANVKN